MYQTSHPTTAGRLIDGEDRGAVCHRYQGKVLYLARRLAERLPADAGISVEDLASYGAIGLLEAFDHFDESLNIRFGTFAEYRIRGAMLDALRSMDALSRRQRSMARQIDQAHRDLQAELGSPPTPEQVAERLGLDMDEYWRALDQSAPVAHMSLDDSDGSSREGDGISESMDMNLATSGDDVLVAMASVDTRRMLWEAVEALPERKRHCVKLYYGRDCSLAEIAEIYGVSVSRISQILTEARLTLRKALQEQITAQDLDWREAI
ncbi:MAG: sigma-70 family RNA polymerase sigma factor [Pseudomonadota bacterium]